jgi:hypothetical protein
MRMIRIDKVNDNESTDTDIYTSLKLGVDAFNQLKVSSQPYDWILLSKSIGDENGLVIWEKIVRFDTYGRQIEWYKEPSAFIKSLESSEVDE